MKPILIALALAALSVPSAYADFDDPGQGVAESGSSAGMLAVGLLVALAVRQKLKK